MPSAEITAKTVLRRHESAEQLRQGIEPLAYLRDVLIRLPKMLITEVASITPQAWAKAQRQPIELKVAS